MTAYDSKLAKKQDIDKKITEQRVLQEELSSLRKGAKVYKQQQNSSLCFLSSAEKEMAKSKVVLNKLLEEYKTVEEPRDRDLG